MSASGSYDSHASHRSVDAEIQRLAAQARSGWAKESRMLSWFGLKDGMSVLELGSGPGFITEQLLALLPNSTVTCLDIDPAMLRQAQEYLGDSASQRVQFIEGSVLNIQQAAGQFDCAYGRFLFQHLPDPVSAAHEIWRVLKPGGKLIIHDIDDGLFGIFQPPLAGLELVVEKFGQAQAARGGNRHIGRSLWHILTAAGFRQLDLDIIASHSGDVGVQPFLQQLDPDRLQSLVDKGLLSAQELARYRAAHAELLQAPESFIVWLSFMICGTKPVPG